MVAYYLNSARKMLAMRSHTKNVPNITFYGVPFADYISVICRPRTASMSLKDADKDLCVGVRLFVILGGHRGHFVHSVKAVACSRFDALYWRVR